MYKYMSADVAKIVLSSNSLRWSTPRVLNDPFDIQFSFRCDIDESLLRAKTKEKILESILSDVPIVDSIIKIPILLLRMAANSLDREKLIFAVNQAVDNINFNYREMTAELCKEALDHLKDSKILCLSRVCDNLLMWTHYANKHTGVVISFKNVEGLDSPWVMARSVDYSDEVPYLLNEESLSDLYSGRVKLDSRDIINKLVYTKNSQFGYENEVRIYSGWGRDKDAEHEDVPFHVDEIDSIIFGSRIDNDDYNEIRKILNEKYIDVKIKKCNLDTERFGIIIEDVE